MDILITGGAGFIGAHLTRALLAQGRRVTVLDTAPAPRALAGHKLLDHRQASVLDDALVTRLVAEADLVVHLAGIAEPARYGADPVGTMDVTLRGSLHLIRCCADRGVPVLFASTSEIYGINPALPWAEGADRVLGPVHNTRWCYATAKAAVEHYLDACHRQLGLRYTVIRLFNTYGPGLRGRVVDGFVRDALAGRPLLVQDDGRQTRCFCYVDDVVDALLRLLARPFAGAATYNVGSDTETEIGALARLVVAACASRSPVLPAPPPYDGWQDVPRRRPDIGAIFRDLGWAPTTSLPDGLTRMIAAARNEAASGGQAHDRAA